MGRDIPHFKQFIKKELEKETKENTSPATIETKAGMVVIRSKQRQQDALEEEERLGQEEDGAVMTDLEVGENTTEASGGEWMEEQSSGGLEKDVQPKECSIEVPGENQTQELNTEGDGVSEDVEGVTTEVLTKEKLGKAQRYESDLQGIREKAERSGNPYFWQGGLLMRKSYQILGKNLLIMPKIARQKVLTMAHNSPIGGHFGRERTLQTIRGRMDRPGVVRDVNRMCAACPICQKAKPANTTKAPLQPLPVIKEPLTRLAMDIVGPLKCTKKGNKYLLVIMDYATNWPEAFPLRNTLTETVVERLVEVTARLGVPQELLTDNGSNFVSKVMQRFCTVTGIKQIRTYPYHPQTNGIVERFNVTIKHFLRKLVSKTIVYPMYYGLIGELSISPRVSTLTNCYLERP